MPTVSITNPGTLSSFDGDVVNLAVQYTDTGSNPFFSAPNLPSGLSINSSNGNITGSLSSTAHYQSPYSTAVNLMDITTMESTSQTFTWNVAQPTVTLTNPGNWSDFGGDTVNVGLIALDSASHQLTFGAPGLPAGLSVVGSQIVGTIANNAQSGGPYSDSVTVTATDAAAGVSASQTFTWNVTPYTATVSLANPGNEGNFDGDTISIPLMGSDSVGDPLTYGATGLPAGLSVVGSQIVGAIASNADTAGPYSVTVTATDSAVNASTSQAFTWSVVARTPTVSLTNPGNKSNLDGDTVSIPLTGSGSTGDPLTYSATSLPAGLSVVGSNIVGTIANLAYAAGPYLVTVTATDNATGVSASQSLTYFCLATTSESADTPSATALTTSANPSSFGQSITFTATVTGAGNTPTGNVTFMDDNTNLGTRPLNASAQATFTTSTLSIGSHGIYAVYNGDANFARSLSPFVSQTVNGGFATGKVWVDANANGLQDPGEVGPSIGPSDVTVNLLNIRGAVVATTTTTHGNYSFSGLIPSTWYAVQVVKPAGYEFTFFQQGNNRALDSDTDADGRTNDFQVAAGSTMAQDSGLIFMTGRTTGTISGPGAVPGNSMYTYFMVSTGRPCVSWNTAIVSPTGRGANPVSSGDMRSMYDATTNTTLRSFDLAFRNSTPADIIESAYVGGRAVASKEIYVVQVLVSDPQGGGAQAFTPGTPQQVPGTVGPPVLPRPMKVVLSGVATAPGVDPPNPGLGWKAVITLVGPNNNQGVNSIRVGFIQHATTNRYAGNYGGNNYMVSPLVGQSAIDLGNGSGPWYDQNVGWNGLQPTFFNATQQVSSATIASFDTPGVVVDASAYGGNNNLQGINYLATFNLDVATETTDTSNGANLSFFGEARATWSFNGTGTVAALAWTSNGAGVAAPPSWATNTPATLMPETYAGQTGNQLFNQFQFNNSTTG